MTKTLAMTGFPGGGAPVNSSLKAKKYASYLFYRIHFERV